METYLLVLCKQYVRTNSSRDSSNIMKLVNRPFELSISVMSNVTSPMPLERSKSCLVQDARVGMATTIAVVLHSSKYIAALAGQMSRCIGSIIVTTYY